MSKGRRKGSDNFGYKKVSIDNKDVGFGNVKNFDGADSTRDLSREQPLRKRFRPEFGTKEYSLVSSWDYKSLWSRWQRGFSMHMLGQNALMGLPFTYKLFVSGLVGVGGYIGGIVYQYPSKDADQATYYTSVRPRNAYDFRFNNNDIIKVTPQLDKQRVAVTLRQKGFVPIALFQGEVVSNRYNKDGDFNGFPVNNYGVIATGIDDGSGPVEVDPYTATPDQQANFNTLFLSLTEDLSWSVVNLNNIAVPAIKIPEVGQFLSTDTRIQCSCPDFAGREGYNFWKTDLANLYPYSSVDYLTPGFFDAGPDASPRYSQSDDYPGYARTFGFIYTRNLYSEGTASFNDTVTYPDVNLFYQQIRFCKHCYAALFDLAAQENIQAETAPYLKEPSDDPVDPVYRQYFLKTLEKEMDIYRNIAKLEYYQMYGKTPTDGQASLSDPAIYTFIQKTFNIGKPFVGLGDLASAAFEVYSLDEYNPFTDLNNVPMNGGEYRNGEKVSRFSEYIAEEREYKNGQNAREYFQLPSLFDGGYYTRSQHISDAEAGLNGNVYAEYAGNSENQTVRSTTRPTRTTGYY